MFNDKRTMFDLVRNALQVQDAVNLSGVVHSFYDDIRRLRELLREQGNLDDTETMNTHPVCILYINKLADLSGASYDTAFHNAYEWCKQVRVNEAIGKSEIPPLSEK